ncbi:MAG: hypothetical protein AB1782_11330 [Cyanobacteriota bacterium]
MLENYSCCPRVEPIDYDICEETETRLNLIVSHMYQQYQEYLQATINTSKTFDRLLDEMKNVAGYFKSSFMLKNIAATQVFYEIDADRSVGILNVLWHSVSFTTRGNTKPQALQRKDEPPLFCGRIIALNGDFQDVALELQDQEYPDILRCELASLYIPHDPELEAIVKIKHLPEKEFYYDQRIAPRQFLLKTIESICGGGIYHEEDPDIEEYE